MIYILIESIMNGAVTTSHYVTGIEAPDFEAAKGKVKGLRNVATGFYVTETSEDISLAPKELQQLQVYGHMKNEPMKII